MECKEKLANIQANKGPFYPLFLCAELDGEMVECLAIKRNESGEDEIFVHGEVTDDGEVIKQALLEWSKTMTTPSWIG